MWFGKYLVECGDVSQKQLVAAISNHCEGQISIGKLAIEGGILTVKQVSEILETQVGSERPFGEIGIQLGFLTESQLCYLLGKQRLTSPGWQKILMDKDVISREDLDKRLCEWHLTTRKEIASESHLLGPG